ncbi:hypothetical protein OA871_01640 [Paracoccaceae bacterium]|nr:hypothetical protein [Paracoccaceae bacterium]
MVESESFIKEVSEEVKRDRLFKALNKFKWPLFALIVLLVGAVGGYEYYKYDKKTRAQKNGEFLISAIEGLKENGQTVTEKIDNKFTSVLIKLNEAKYFEEKGDMKSASAAYNYIISKYGENKFFNHYSKFQLYLMDPAKNLGDVKKIKILDELSAPDSPLKLLALEQKLYLYVKINDLENIKLQVDLILSDQAITPEQVTRIKDVESVYELN